MNPQTSKMEDIDWSATKEKFDELYSQTRVAKGLDVSKTAFSQILNGIYPYPAAPSVQKVIGRLDELKVLVRKEAGQKAA